MKRLLSRLQSFRNTLVKTYLIGFGIVVLLFVLLFVAAVVPEGGRFLYLLWVLGTGWLSFWKMAVIRAAQLDVSLWYVAAVVMLVVGAHFTLARWLSAGQWRFRSTLIASVFLVIGILTAISIVAIAHQVGWMMSSGQPIWEEISFGVRHSDLLNVPSGILSHGGLS